MARVKTLTSKVVAAIIVSYCDLPKPGPEPSWEAWFLCYLPESPSWDSILTLCRAKS